jgi:hypothetical protein
MTPEELGQGRRARLSGFRPADLVAAERLMLRRAATGSAKNITPNRVKPRSKVLPEGRMSRRRPAQAPHCRRRGGNALASKSQLLFRYVNAEHAAGWPQPSACLSVAVQVPQPMSSTFSLGLGAAAANAASVTPRCSRTRAAPGRWIEDHSCPVVLHFRQSERRTWIGKCWLGYSAAAIICDLRLYQTWAVTAAMTTIPPTKLEPVGTS